MPHQATMCRTLQAGREFWAEQTFPLWKWLCAGVLNRTWTEKRFSWNFVIVHRRHARVFYLYILSSYCCWAASSSSQQPRGTLDTITHCHFERTSSHVFLGVRVSVVVCLRICSRDQTIRLKLCIVEKRKTDWISFGECRGTHFP